MALDFSPFKLIEITWKIQNGVELSNDEKDLYEQEKKRKQDEEEKQKRWLSERPYRNARNRRTAIQKMESKFCPLLQSPCIGEECAFMKVLEKPRIGMGIDPDKEYEAMCAFNIPDKGTKVSYNKNW